MFFFFMQRPVIGSFQTPMRLPTEKKRKLKKNVATMTKIFHQIPIAKW